MKEKPVVAQRIHSEAPAEGDELADPTDIRVHSQEPPKAPTPTTTNRHLRPLWLGPAPEALPLTPCPQQRWVNILTVFNLSSARSSQRRRCEQQSREADCG
ncbi:hypothetical protein AHiyo4_46800 [Arthrobacter sp. Hiyo4]|nr:hypothetical protein AHiyo4_46800 [Arthrobacter sp. Hiyo4]